MSAEYVLEVDHNQFYLEDDRARPPRHPWGDRALLDRVDTAPGHLAVLAGRFGGEVRVMADVLDARPGDGFDPRDQVVGRGLGVPSGRIALSSPETRVPEGARRGAAPPGTHRAPVYPGNLDSVDAGDGYEGGDFYRVALWPGAAAEARVLKRETGRYEAKLREQRASADRVAENVARRGGPAAGSNEPPPVSRRSRRPGAFRVSRRDPGHP